MFTASEREAIRQAVLEKAKSDPRITGGAITGSASVGKEDAWSDIDLAFGVRTGTTLQEVLNDFTRAMGDNHGAVDWFDVPSGAWNYRVFLLASTLQVDLAFAPEVEFGARAPTFQLQFGAAVELPAPNHAKVDDLIGMAWLYALHIRSSLARDRLWQAEYFLSAMRNQVLAIACRRLGLPERDGRGFHLLPSDFLESMRGAHPASLDLASVQVAFQTVTDVLLSEIELVNPEQAERLETTLGALAQPFSVEG